MSQDSPTWEDDLAYFFWPHQRHSDPGHPRLEVKLFGSPSNQHFDPEHLEVLIKSPGEAGANIELQKIYHPWTSPATLQVAAGSLAIVDWRQKEVDVFSYGGSIHIANHNDFAVCTFESPAPIINLKDCTENARMMVEETEIILARRRAAWDNNEAEFDRRLALIEPLKLYIVCLNTLHSTFSRSHHKDLPHISNFLNFIHAETTALESSGQWGLSVPELEDVL